MRTSDALGITQVCAQTFGLCSNHQRLSKGLKLWSFRRDRKQAKNQPDLMKITPMAKIPLDLSDEIYPAINAAVFRINGGN